MKKDKTMTRADYRLVPHPKFGFLQIKPTPTSEEITKFYKDEFYSSAYPRFNNSALDAQLMDKEFLDAHREDLCGTIQAMTGKSLAGLEALDIGCGWAQTLIYFKQKGMIGHGFDPAPEAVAYGKEQGLNVIQAGLERMDVFGDKKFDVVTLLNVLEHAADPAALLKEVCDKVLKRGGVLLVEVPNEFNAFQVAGREVHQLEEWWVAPPAHLNYFNNDSLRKLLQGTGYEVKLTEACFPMEMFLLFGDNYVKDRPLGRKCHERRMAFELNLRRQGRTGVLRKFYQSLAEQNLGRQITAFAAGK